jgi:hypothetical protein
MAATLRAAPSTGWAAPIASCGTAAEKHRHKKICGATS